MATSPPRTPSSPNPGFNEGAAHVAAPSRFGAPDLADCPADIRAVIVFLAYAKRPEHFRAFMHYHDLLMKGDGGLTRAEREAIVVAVSAENDCQYCVTAHGAALRILSKDPVAADQIAINWRTADLAPRLRTILEFASAVNQPGFSAGDERIAELRARGLSDDDIWDIAAIAAFFGFSNRMAGALDMRPNLEFYAMGRAGAANANG